MDFEANAQLLVTTFTSGSIVVTLTWTDENNGAESVTMTSKGATGWANGAPVMGRAKAATAITIATTGSFSATYNIQAYLRTTT